MLAVGTGVAGRKVGCAVIEYTCPHCGRLLQIPDEYAGKRGGCKECHATFTVPAETLPKSSPSAARPVGLSTKSRVEHQLCVPFALKYVPFVNIHLKPAYPYWCMFVTDVRIVLVNLDDTTIKTILPLSKPKLTALSGPEIDFVADHWEKLMFWPPRRWEPAQPVVPWDIAQSLRYLSVQKIVEGLPSYTEVRYSDAVRIIVRGSNISIFSDTSRVFKGTLAPSTAWIKESINSVQRLYLSLMDVRDSESNVRIVLRKFLAIEGVAAGTALALPLGLIPLVGAFIGIGAVVIGFTLPQIPVHERLRPYMVYRAFKSILIAGGLFCFFLTLLCFIKPWPMPLAILLLTGISALIVWALIRGAPTSKMHTASLSRTISVFCPICTGQLSILEKFFGRRVTCANCGNFITVPRRWTLLRYAEPSHPPTAVPLEQSEQNSLAATELNRAHVYETVLHNFPGIIRAEPLIGFLFPEYWSILITTRRLLFLKEKRAWSHPFLLGFFGYFLSPIADRISSVRTRSTDGMSGDVTQETINFLKSSHPLHIDIDLSNGPNQIIKDESMGHMTLHFAGARLEIKRLGSTRRLLLDSGQELPSEWLVTVTIGKDRIRFTTWMSEAEHFEWISEMTLKHEKNNEQD